MHRSGWFRTAILFGWSTIAAVTADRSAGATEPCATDAVYELIFARTDANGVTFPHMVDPPVWANTRHLLEGPSHVRMLKLLDEVVDAQLDDSAIGLRRRALLQHDLWRLFDWTVTHDLSETPAAKSLRTKLARTIRHVALSKAQIEALTSNLPTSDGDGGAPNVLDPSAGWISLGRPDDQSIAPQHMIRFEGRSAFGVFLCHAEGANSAAAFLKRLAEVPFPLPATHEGSSMLVRDAARPDFPIGTKVALLRRMILIDRAGDLIGSPIVQSLQLRTILEIKPDVRAAHFRMQEFTLDRAAYISGKSDALYAVGLEDREPTIFFAKGYDELERRNSVGPVHPQPLVLVNCINCHRSPGVLSLNSYSGVLSSKSTMLKNPRLEPRAFEREVDFAVRWKREQSSWRELNAVAQP